MNTFASSTPDTESDSSVIAVMSDNDSWVCPASRRRTRPTRTCSTTKIGIRATATSVSCHDSSSIAMSDATTVTVLDRIELAVSDKHRLHAADVVGQPRLDRAGAGGGEEREVHALQVLEEPAAQVRHHAVAEQRRQVRLPDADQRGHDRDRDHARDEPAQQRQVDRPAADREQRPVERHLGEEGRDDPEAAGDEDGGPDRHQRASIRGEQSPHPATEPLLFHVPGR